MNRKAIETRIKNKKFKTQKRNICSKCRNANSYNRKFGVCKKDLFLLINKGVIPGYKGSSF